MEIGYSRSRDKHELKEQNLKLMEVGCENVYSERCTSKIEQGKYKDLTEDLRVGDRLTVTSIYIFPVTMIELVDFLAYLKNEGIGFRSLREDITDMNVFAWLHTYQKRSRGERSMAQLNGAVRRGRKSSGRPKGLSAEAKKEMLAVVELYDQGYKVTDIMKELEMTSKSQVYKRLRDGGREPGRHEKN